MFPRHRQRSIAFYLSLTVAFLLLGALLLLRPTATRAQNQPEALGSVSGTVRNAQGDPLPNITVWLEHYRGQFPQRSIVTNGEGEYQFLSVLSGIYYLRFEDAQNAYATQYYSDANFSEDAETVTVNGNMIDGINMELSASGSLSVTLSHAEPITASFYSVILYRQTASERWAVYRSVPLMEGGMSALAVGLIPGNYRLCANGYFSSSNQISVECYNNTLPDQQGQLAPNASDIPVQADEQTNISIVFEDIIQVEGHLFGPNNQPIADIPVMLIQSTTQSAGGGEPVRRAQSNENGYFHFSHINSGNYHLVFNYPDYPPQPYLTVYYPNEYSSANAGNLSIDGSTRFSITQELIPEARITGKVTMPDDTPLNWASIIVYYQRPDGIWVEGQCNEYCFPAVYDSNTGQYTVTQLLAGRYRLVAQYFVPNTQSYIVTYYGGDSFDSADDIVLGTGEAKANINFTFGANSFDGSIAGRVTANGAPKQGIEVGLFTSGYPSYDPSLPYVTTMTNAQGRYKLEGLTAGGYTVGFRDPAGIYATAFYSGSTYPFYPNLIFLTSTTTLDNIDMQLSLGGTIRGHVRTDQGKQPGGFSVHVTYPNGHPFYTIPLPYVDAKTDANGFFELTGLPPGEYLLRAVTPLTGGEHPPQLTLYYPGTNDVNRAQNIAVEAGKVVEKKDIFFYFTPTIFMPIIRDNLAAPTVLPAASATPTPPRPTPTPTPVIP